MNRLLFLITLLTIPVLALANWMYIPGPGYSHDVGVSSGTWVTVGDYLSTFDLQYTDSGTRNYRLVVPTTGLTANGTKVRITFSRLNTSGTATIGALAIGPSTTADDFDSSPTQITFSGNSTVNFSSTTLISDEIDFSFNYQGRYVLHMYTTARNFAYSSTYKPMYYSAISTNNSQTLSVNYSSGGSMIGISKIEVYVP